MKKEVYEAVIIDDEKPARDLIRNFLHRYDEIRSVGEADNGFEACRLINDKKPDLAFLDIQMPKLNGIELLELLEDPLPFIIFSTAFDEFAVKAFDKNALDYLLKPYNKDRFDQAIQRFLQNADRNSFKERQKKLIENMRKSAPLSRIPVRTGSRIMIIKIEEVKYFEAQDDYVKIITPNGFYLKQITMNYLEENLPEDFIRIHRSYIINMNYLKQLELLDSQNYMAVISDRINLPVSRSGAGRLKDHMNLN